MKKVDHLYPHSEQVVIEVFKFLIFISINHEGLDVDSTQGPCTLELHLVP